MDERPGDAEPSDPAPDPPARTSTAGTAVVCALCGSSAASPPLTWLYEADRNRGDRWYCDACARRHLRAVEAKLDQQWW